MLIVVLIVLYDVSIDILHSKFKYILYTVWFIPAALNSVFISVIISPAGIILIFTFGPNPAKYLLPTNAPIGISTFCFPISFISFCISIAISDIIWFKVTISVFNILLFPSSLFIIFTVSL